jgi:hypothetical protein
VAEENLVADRYLLTGSATHGAQAHVYAASDTVLGRKVALKISRGRRADGRIDFGSMLSREAKVIASLSHPNVVAIFDCFHLNDRFAFVMPFFDGDLTLAIAHRSDIDYQSDIVPIFQSVAVALDFCADKGIAHRDIKPGNVLVGPGGHGVLCDFGVSGRMDKQEDWEKLYGTEPYLSPEVLLYDSIPELKDPEFRRAYDQFGFGVTVYQALTGRLPFEASESPFPSTTAERLILREKFAPCHFVNQRLLASVNDIVSKMLSIDPRARFPSNADAVEALRSAFAGHVQGAKNVFISYNHTDRPYAERVVKALKQKLSGEIYWDRLLTAGLDWDDQIEVAMIDAEFMIVLLSEAAVASDEVRSEWHYWIGHLRRPLLSIVLDECRVPYRLFRLHHLIPDSPTWWEDEALGTMLANQISEAMEATRRRRPTRGWDEKNGKADASDAQASATNLQDDVEAFDDYPHLADFEEVESPQYAERGFAVPTAVVDDLYAEPQLTRLGDEINDLDTQVGRNISTFVYRNPPPVRDTMVTRLRRYVRGLI